MYDDDLLLQCIQAVNEEIATHIECLADDELFPEHRTHIELNLAGGCARGLQVIGMHQKQLSWQLDRLAADQIWAEEQVEA